MVRELTILFAEVERHVAPLLGNESGSRFSKDESSVLALQSIHRLNQRIGFLARTASKKLDELKLLQTFVNNLTLGVKNGTPQQIRPALDRIRNIIATIEKTEK